VRGIRHLLCAGAATIATHNMDPAARMDRRVTLREGQVVELEGPRRPRPARPMSLN